MGVTGLLPQLKDIQQNVSLKKFRGKTVAIDSYAWLHRAVFSCSWELAQDMATDKYIAYFQRRIQMLQHFGVTPYFVFDGDDFNSKEGTEVERSKSRLLNKEKGLECLKNGDRKNASLFFSKCIDVTPEMAKSVIEYLKGIKVKYIVAPYEADAQLVYLENLGLVDAIISEDSDLLVFGAKILLTKLNEFGECIEINREDFKKCKNFPFGLLNQDQLRITACLSGCDYTNGIPNIGIIKALRLVKRLSNMKRCLSSLRLEGKNFIPKGFELEYEKANLSFQFQRVFNPIKDEISTLNKPSELDLKNPLFQECIGSLLDNETHLKIAYGELNPITKEVLLPRDKFVAKKIVLTQFIDNKPIQSSTRKNIETFFKPCSKSVNPTPIKPFKDDTNLELSPISKRRKLFNSTSKVMTTSKFFRSNTEPTRPNYVNDSPLISKTVPATQEDPQKLDLNSSEYELSDIDDEDPQQQALDEDTTQKDIQYDTKDMKVTSDIGNDTIEESEISLEMESQPLPTTKRLLDALQTEPVKTPPLVASLYERFALSRPKERVKAPLSAITNTAGTRKSVTVKSGRSVMRLATLDQFVYRE